MGIRYSIDLYFPIEHLELALLETVKFAYSDRDPRETVSIKLLDGKEITVPFMTSFKPGRLELKNGSGAFELDTGFSFPLDDPLLEYVTQGPPEFRENWIVERDSEKFVYIGYIYLTLHISYRYVRFHFTAAGTSMSRLFLASRSIHRQFLKLLDAAQGVAGLIDTESNEYPLLTDPQQKIHFDETDYLVNEGEEYYANGYVDIDRLTDTILHLTLKK